MQTSHIPLVATFLRDLQDRLCAMFESFEPSARFHEDAWTRDEGGGGRTRVLRGEVLEQAGVGFSHVHGARLPPSATAQRPELSGCPVTAVGVRLALEEAGAAYVTFSDGNAVKLDKLDGAEGSVTQFSNGRFLVEQASDGLRFGRGRAVPMPCALKP